MFYVNEALNGVFSLALIHPEQPTELACMRHTRFRCPPKPPKTLLPFNALPLLLNSLQPPDQMANEAPTQLTHSPDIPWQA